MDEIEEELAEQDEIEEELAEQNKSDFKSALMSFLRQWSAELYNNPSNGIYVELSETKSGDEITQPYQTFLLGHTFNYYG